MEATPGNELTQLLRRWQDGDADAHARAVAMVYPVLRDLARAQARRLHGLTLGSTELAHEAYERLCAQQASWNSRAHFFAIAATVLRRVAVDYMRRRQAEKRGGGVQMVSLDDLSGEQPIAPHMGIDLLALDQALAQLAATDALAARLVEMRLFSGLTIEEAATVTGASTATLNRKWRFARAWLVDALQPEAVAGDGSHAHGE